MIIRTLLFLLVMYVLIKVIARLFLPSGSRKRNSGARIFYRTFQQFQQNQNQQKQKNRRSRNSNQQFEEVEEAEYEDITDDEKSTTKSSD